MDCSYVKLDQMSVAVSNNAQDGREGELKVKLSQENGSSGMGRVVGFVRLIFTNSCGS